jgi:hypothetical protein
MVPGMYRSAFHGKEDPMSVTDYPRSLLLASLRLAALSTSLAGQTVRNHLYDKFQVGAHSTDVILGSTSG